MLNAILHIYTYIDILKASIKLINFEEKKIAKYFVSKYKYI